MPKRLRDDEYDEDESRSAKRLRTTDRLSLLSDELLLRTLSFLSVSDLTLCQRCAYGILIMSPLLTVKTLPATEIPRW